MKQIRLADRTRLAYSLTGRGDGPAIVLCDGISCDGYVWLYLRPHLQRHFRVLHVQWRGHGRSGIPRDPEAVTVPHLAADLDEVMERLGIPTATFVGHSMGVQVALEVAWRFPHRLRAGVLLNGSSGRLLDTFKETDVGMRILPRIKQLTERHRDRVARALRVLMPTELSYLVAAYTEINREQIRREDFMPYLEHFATMPPALFVRMLEDAASRTARHLLPRVPQPMLVVAGDRDGFTPWRVTKELADGLPDSEFHLLEGGSHTAPLEFPERVQVVVDDFLANRRLDRHPEGPAPEQPRPDLGLRFGEAAEDRKAS
ncbi:MAG: alpha/beta fold hydrolase [Myxococcota bacterium]